MTARQKLEYSQLEAVYQFSPASFELIAAIQNCLRATGDTNSLYGGTLWNQKQESN